ncbi:hypothetical protein ATK36_5954 [Amycolatopsis sulphurea]|uniref:Uncharacterized protein n=1 Tax=Amycolatopsis sulphurea TaxID=76022 RepID=A0A2A9FGW7_9PSEU|nr:hypothetical protein ATK36_5954 [Amycolatopsis sulphurea]
MHETQARAFAGAGVPRHHRLPVHHDVRAGIGGVVARQDLDQGRLAGSVFPDQRAHLSGCHAKTDIVEDSLPAKGFRRARDFERQIGHPVR